MFLLGGSRGRKSIGGGAGAAGPHRVERRLTERFARGGGQVLVWPQDAPKQGPCSLSRGPWAPCCSGLQEVTERGCPGGLETDPEELASR